ncbi:right-handed parallel beta-helix repeat-containing protein [Flammeovirgaceae bacterium SG7u.111]|nr:right-handed parallel beta-helix repeat-containing protein [Flammeovirgaceae bacterium SG7u.132]WPO33444.1 right-handed parallel beta-helix repeat-containing protein [Flammeovirgaceae bacterium SG7u.111]
MRTKFYLGIFLLLSSCLFFNSCTQQSPFDSGKIYVSPKGSDDNMGSKDSPFATPFGAKQYIAFQKLSHELPEGGIEVIFREGTYFLGQPLQFTSTDGGHEQAPITYKAFEGEKVVFSGGQEIGGWENVEPGLWKVELPEVKDGMWHFRQLFADGKRLTRARIPNEGYFTTEGALKKYQLEIKPWDFEGRTTLFNNEIEAFCGFEYQEGNMPYIAEEDYLNAEVLTHHSWESSWQTVCKIDEGNNEIYFNTPSWCPVGFFGEEGKHVRFRIENVKSALDEPGEWYLDLLNGELFYLAKEGENVPEISFIAPVLENLITVEAFSSSDKPIEHIRFENIQFSHTAYPMGIYVNSGHYMMEGKLENGPFTLTMWPDHAIDQGVDLPRYANPGYMEPQAALNSGQAVLISDAENVVFLECQFNQLGGYAINIGRRSKQITIDACEISDLGSGGIRLGMWVKDVKRANLKSDIIPRQNIISNTKIHDIGKVHAGAVGIWLAQSMENQVVNNELYNMPYSGISLGWTWNEAETFTHQNYIAYNHIHHVMQTLTDGGGIYTLGKMNGSILKENYIHDIKRAKGAVGSFSNGMFFDQSSQLLTVEGNVIEQVENDKVRFNQTSADKMIWEKNYLDDSSGEKDEVQKVVQKAGVQKDA